MRVHRFLIPACFLAFATAPVMITAPIAHAVIVMGSQGRNTSAPTGTLSLAGWQYEGQFGSFLGTPIGSDYFITAKHIGGSTAVPFVFDNVSYSIDSTFNGGTGVYNIPGTDLNIWKVTGTFPTYAPLYGGGSLTYGSEVGKNMFVTGRGDQRGEPLTLANARLLSGDGTTSVNASAATASASIPGSATNQIGWLWGASDGVESWGTNVVSNTLTDPTLGHFITFTFDQSAGANEAILAAGDSGGGLFVDATGNGDWRLAGINYGVDDPFVGSAGGTAFNAALFDEGGLWNGETNPPQYIADQTANIPANSYDSSISANYAAIEAILASGSNIAELPEPGCVGILLITLAFQSRRLRQNTDKTE